MSDSTYIAVPVDLDELGSRIIGTAGRLAAATCRWLLLVAEFDTRDGCARFGLGTISRWLSHTCGISRRTAIDHVRVARALAAFPALAAAMSAGRVSYSHARAISRIAAAGDEQLVADLVHVAEHGSVGQLEDMVRGLRTVEANEDPALHAREYFARTWSDDCRWRMNARLSPEHGATVQSAIEALAHAEGLSQADALVRMAEIVHAALHDRRPTPRRLRGDEGTAVVVHLDADLIPKAEATSDADVAAAGTDTSRGDDAPARPGGRRFRPAGRIAHGPGLADSVLTRLLCNGRVRTVLHGRRTDGTRNVLDLGRSHRLVSDRQFRALLLRDHGCTYPGCGSTHRLHAHHVQHWIHGGRTDLANLVLLCEAHHLSLHDGQFFIAPVPEGRFRFTRPDGAVLREHIDPSDHIVVSTPIETEHGDVAADAAMTRWGGERIDRHWAIAGLAAVRDLGRRAG